MRPIALRKKTTDPLSEYFMACLDLARPAGSPFSHWLLDYTLPGNVLDDVAALPFPPAANAVSDGRREFTDASVFFTPKIEDSFYVAREIVSVFSSAAVVETLQAIVETDLARGHLHIEYCRDTDGFWLEPARGMPLSLLTIMIGLSDEPELSEAGIDLYTSERQRVTTTPFGAGKGLIIVPGYNTWHGFEKRPIKGVRKSLVINYVTPDWPNTNELAYQ